MAGGGSSHLLAAAAAAALCCHAPPRGALTTSGCVVVGVGAAVRALGAAPAQGDSMLCVTPRQATGCIGPCIGLRHFSAKKKSNLSLPRFLIGAGIGGTALRRTVLHEHTILRWCAVDADFGASPALKGRVYGCPCKSSVQLPHATSPERRPLAASPLRAAARPCSARIFVGGLGGSRDRARRAAPTKQRRW